MPDLIAASPNCFLEMSPMVAYRQFPALGIRHVEVPCGPTGMAPFAPELIVGDALTAFKERLAGLGVEPITVGAYCDVLTQTELLKRRMDFARAIGARIVVSDATRRPMVEADEWSTIVRTLRELGDHAASRGVKLALETHGGITRNGALCAKLLDAVNHDAVGVNYDTGNIYYYNEGFDPAEDVKLIAHRVVQVHLKDTRGGKGEWLFCGLGEGRVDFPAVVKTLREAGFDGPWSLEIEGERGEDLTRAQSAERIRRSLGYLKSIGFDFELPGESGEGAGLQAQETGH
jgi:L-ribulose-5-phosphate 3-epimerase